MNYQRRDEEGLEADIIFMNISHPATTATYEQKRNQNNNNNNNNKSNNDYDTQRNINH